MTKTALKALAFACATLGAAYFAPAHADETKLDISAYTEANLPQDVYEEMGTLSLDGTDLGIEARRDGRGDRGRGHDGGRHDGRHGDRHDGHPGWHGPRHPGHGGPHYPWPPRYDQTTCFARNGRGVVFRASGFGNRWSVQNAAIRVCRRNSFRPNSCRPLGCR